VTSKPTCPRSFATQRHNGWNSYAYTTSDHRHTVYRHSHDHV